MNNFIKFILILSFLGLIIGCSASKEELLIIQKQNQAKAKRLEQQRQTEAKRLEQQRQTEKLGSGYEFPLLRCKTAKI